MVKRELRLEDNLVYQLIYIPTQNSTSQFSSRVIWGLTLWDGVRSTGVHGELQIEPPPLFCWEETDEVVQNVFWMYSYIGISGMSYREGKNPQGRFTISWREGYYVSYPVWECFGIWQKAGEMDDWCHNDPRPWYGAEIRECYKIRLLLVVIISIMVLHTCLFYL